MVTEKLNLAGFEEFYYISRAFKEKHGGDVFHGFFTRHGGVSTDLYSSLNCGLGSGDDHHKVTQNRRLVEELSGAKKNSLVSLYQIHSAECVIVDQPLGDDARQEGDALVTDKAGILLGILTADCAPVLFSGRKKDGSQVVGAAHAGWGGAFKGVLSQTVEKMKSLGAELETISACIGPCISQESYEVGRDFYERFLGQDQENAAFFIPSAQAEHYMFDLPAYVRKQLEAAGVKQIEHKDLDTYFNEEDFYSYRRTTHRKEPDYGRQISVIKINE